MAAQKGLPLEYAWIYTGKSKALHEKLAKQRWANLCPGIGWHVWHWVVRSAKCGFLAASLRGALGCSQLLLGGEIPLPNPKFNFNAFFFFKFASLCSKSG